MSVILFLIILVILIVSHEFGHFIVAKWAGIRVDEFAVGFPPRVWSKKKGETEYSLNALPIGGYVKIFGENPPENEQVRTGKDEESIYGPDYQRSFIAQKKNIQALVVFAGVAFNAILAWVLLSFGFIVGLPTAITGSGYEKYAHDTAFTITGVIPGSPAEKAGLKTGDKMISLSSGGNEKVVSDSEEVQKFITDSGYGKISVKYERGGEVNQTEVVPKSGIIEGRPAIGISTDWVGTVRLPFYLAFWEGAKNTGFLFYETTAGLFNLIKSALVGQGSLSAVSGPVGIVKMVGEASALGFAYLLNFTAIISINLAVINLIPVPALDGGRLFFILIEKIKGSPIKPSIANAVNTAGFALLMILMVVVTYHDIARLVVR